MADFTYRDGAFRPRNTAGTPDLRVHCPGLRLPADGQPPWKTRTLCSSTARWMVEGDTELGPAGRRTCWMRWSGRNWPGRAQSDPAQELSGAEHEEMAKCIVWWLDYDERLAMPTTVSPLALPGPTPADFVCPECGAGVMMAPHGRTPTWRRTARQFFRAHGRRAYSLALLQSSTAALQSAGRT